MDSVHEGFLATLGFNYDDTVEMNTTSSISNGSFDQGATLDKLKHYLPAQAPLKDFVHHNTLHAFQQEKFEYAIRKASKIFGYKVSLSLEEFRELYKEGKIDKDILENVLQSRKGEEEKYVWLDKLLNSEYDNVLARQIGRLRQEWKNHYHLDLDTIVHTNLFRILNSYLDQGIALSKFPNTDGTFMESIKNLERNSYVSLFKTKRAKQLLNKDDLQLSDLLKILVGDEGQYEHYLFDQQFAHPGWSGLVAVLEHQPKSLLDHRSITLLDFIILECLLEIDNLDNSLSSKWKPIGTVNEPLPFDFFEDFSLSEFDEVLNIWQEAYEWTYYDEVLGAVKSQNNESTDDSSKTPSFQAFFCIDDRECSIRRHIEKLDTKCETYGTPGHFGVDTFYQPENGKHYTKICPAPITPNHLIKEVSTKTVRKKEIHFSKHTHGLFVGWVIAQSLGFWSAIKLMLNIFKPSFGPASSSSFQHMEEYSALTVENRSNTHKVDGLLIGYTIEEMVDRVETVLRSTGLEENFAPLVYIMGHGASSANNTHYAGYDCGACSGRPGSVNARAFCVMANHKLVREKLALKGIVIPDETEFLGGLHDTTRDEFVFFDEGLLCPGNMRLHKLNQMMFVNALSQNAKERSRRFELTETKGNSRKVHNDVKKRSVSLFEPRPELNHATNSLCIIGRRGLNKNLFLDRRAFLNSYDYKLDPDGKYLATIINAAAPVCGGINLEYYFSRVDNEKLGAGSKLPHNVMGLIGVANGFEGDLRPGLPIQMVEVHDPIRLLMIVEQYPNVVLETIQRTPATYEWFLNEWVILAVKDPDTGQIHSFKDGRFNEYQPSKTNPDSISDLTNLIETKTDNSPVYQLN